jgi:hypothetical protein
MTSAARAFEVSNSLASVEAIEADLARLTGAITENQFHAQPFAGGWSPAYCIEHLVLAGNALLPSWDAALRRAPRDEGPLSYGWWHRLVLGAMERPRCLRLKTASRFVPRSRRPMSDVVARFLAMHSELKRRIEQTHAAGAAQTRVGSPFTSWLRYPLGFSFDLALAHERRHLWQAWQVLHQVSRNGSGGVRRR